MPRHGTTDIHAELAVELYGDLLAERGWGLDQAWLAIAALLMTCEIWRDGEWRSSMARLCCRSPTTTASRDAVSRNRALAEALRVRRRLTDELGVGEQALCGEIGRFFRHPDIVGLQPNNPRGHAFRSLVAETLARFGDPRLDVREEVSPHELFPGFDFGNRSSNARIDIVVQRGPRVVALITTRWTYRHDRVDIIDEALAYTPAARRENAECRFYGVTAEFVPGRLHKVIEQTEPAMPNAAINRLVHLQPELAGALLGRNGGLEQMWSLARMVEDSGGWR